MEEIYPVVLRKKDKAYKALKRIMDFFLAFSCLLIISPLFLIISLGIKCESPKENIFFRQERVGCGGKIFQIIKFRSMRSDTPPNMATGQLENPEQYISAIGKFIRKSSIDELPQLWNVVKGDMSLIGPRPLILAEKEMHTLREHYGIYQILPGITGLAQVNGRDSLDDNKKVYYDWQYLRNFGLIQDIKVLINTTKVVMAQEGYREGKNVKETEEVSDETYIHSREQGNTGEVRRI